MKYGYARVSTCGQARKGNSLKDQEAMLKAAGATKIYCDSFTGTKMDRPEFDNLLSVLQPGDELVVAKLDRFARTAPEGALLVRGLVSRGIKVNILNMGVADNTAMGKLIVNILLSFAEFERDMIVERTTAGKEYARAHKQGYKEGRPKIAESVFKNAEKAKKDNQLTVQQVCEQFGFSRSAWYAWKKETA